MTTRTLRFVSPAVLRSFGLSLLGIVCIMLAASALVYQSGIREPDTLNDEGLSRLVVAYEEGGLEAVRAAADQMLAFESEVHPALSVAIGSQEFERFTSTLDPNRSERGRAQDNGSGSIVTLHARATLLPGNEPLLIGRDAAPLKRRLLTIMSLGFIVLITVSLLAFRLASQQTRALEMRLAEVAQQAVKIADGDVSLRPETGHENDASGHVDRDLNRLIDALARRIEHQKSFPGQLAHELRTPLARLSAKLDGFAETSPAGEVKALRLNIVDVSRTLQDMLVLSSIEMSVPAPDEWSQINLRGMCEEVYSVFEDACEDKAIILAIEAPENVECGQSASFETYANEYCRQPGATYTGGRPGTPSGG